MRLSPGVDFTYREVPSPRAFRCHHLTEEGWEHTQGQVLTHRSAVSEGSGLSSPVSCSVTILKQPRSRQGRPCSAQVRLE